MLSRFFKFMLLPAERGCAQGPGAQQLPDDPPTGPRPQDEDPSGGNVIRLMPRPRPEPHMDPAPPPDGDDDPGPRAA